MDVRYYVRSARLGFVLALGFGIIFAALTTSVVATRVGILSESWLNVASLDTSDTTIAILGLMSVGGFFVAAVIAGILRMFEP